MWQESVPRARVLWSGTVNNVQIQNLVVACTQIGGTQIRWPDQLPRQDAGRIAYEYVRGCTQYSEEDVNQRIRLPRAFIQEKVGDCKSTAVFIGSMAKAAGRDVVIRFVLIPPKTWFGHVYAMVDGVACDPLLTFGNQPLYLWRKDVRI